MSAQPAKIMLPCDHCQTPFEQSRKWQRFCCERCRKLDFEAQVRRDAVAAYLSEMGKRGAVVTKIKREARAQGREVESVTFQKAPGGVVPMVRYKTGT